MTLTQLNSEIAITRKHLCDLNKRRDAILARRKADERARNLKMLKLFDDDGLDSVEIGRKFKLSDTLVRQFLYARGRTKRGREAIRSQLAIVAGDNEVTSSAEVPPGSLALAPSSFPKGDGSPASDAPKRMLVGTPSD